MNRPVNLVRATLRVWVAVLGAATRLGARDAMEELPTRSGEELAHIFATRYRIGHARALRKAYMAGRFHIEVMDRP